jgi:hypothetical protein
MEIPPGFTKLNASVFRKDEVIIVSGVLDDGEEFSFAVKLATSEALDPEQDPATWGSPPIGFEWTGEVRPPKKGEFFWSEIRGDVVRAQEDETGVNRLGEPTGGRRILKAIEPTKPERTGLRLVK